MKTLHEFIEMASNVPPGGLEAARTIMYEMKNAGFPKSEVQHVASVIADTAGIDKVVMGTMYKEAAHHHPDHGALMTVTAVGEAALNDLSVITQTFVKCGTNFYAWWTNSTDHGGILRTLNRNDLKHILRNDYAGHPIVESRSKLEDVVDFIDLRVTDSHFLDRRPSGVCVKNGWLEFDPASRTLQLKPHGPETKATYSLAATYDPEAQAAALEGGLRRLLPEDRVCAMQEFIGCTLFGIRLDGDNARNCLMLYGPPSSGKSSITEIIAATLPSDVIASLPPDKWSKTESVSALLGKSLNIVTETGQKTKIRSADFKTIVSGERVTGRYRYGDEFSFQPTAKHILATNTIPKFDIADEALCRRILAIQFDRSLTRDQIDPDFVEKVKAELPGFINWCAEGAKRAMERGYFALPACHDTVTELIMFGDDLVGAFANRMIEVTGAQTDAVSTVELRTALKRFAEERGVDVSDWTVNTHARQLGTLLQEKYQAHRVQRDGLPHYLRIRLRSPEVPG